MPGLLDNPWLAMGSGLLNAAGPTLLPGRSSLGYGLQSGLDNLAAVRDRTERSQFNNLRMTQIKAQMARAQAQEAAARQAAIDASKQQEAQRAAQMRMVGLFKDPRQQEIAQQMVLAGQGDKLPGLLNQPAKKPSAGEAMVERSMVDPAFRDAWMASKRAGASNIEIQQGGVGFKPQTKQAKLLSDLLGVSKMPPSAERDATEKAIRADLKKIADDTGMSAEEKRSTTRMNAARVLTDHFNQLADSHPLLTGPVEGRRARWGASIGIGDEATGELTAMEAQMKGMLGTALSGAAIPEQEWPTYQAQLPAATDERGLRLGKTKAFHRFMDILTRIQNGTTTIEELRAEAKQLKKPKSTRSFTVTRPR